MIFTTPPKSRAKDHPGAVGAAKARRPTPPGPSAPGPTRKRRRPAIVGLGVALVALGALAMVAITSTLGQTRPVLAVSGDVARGEVIRAQDLTVAEVPVGPTGLRTVASADLGSVVGQRATTRLLPGSLLTPASYAPALEPTAGTSVVGIALTAHQMPTDVLTAGDHVRVVETPETGGALAKAEPVAVEAVVVSASGLPLGDGTIVNVEVDEGEAAVLAARAAAGRVAIVLDAPKG